MTRVVNFPTGFDQKGINTCVFDSAFYRKYWSNNGGQKLAAWASFASEGNLEISAQYLMDPQKFEREGLSVDTFIRFQRDAKTLHNRLEKGTSKAMNVAMVRRAADRYGITKFKPLSGKLNQADQCIGDNINNLLLALTARLRVIVDAPHSPNAGELFLDEVEMIYDIIYGCVTGDGDTESWKQRALADSLELNPNYQSGILSIGSGASFSTSMSNGYEASRKKCLNELKHYGFILSSQKPNKGEFFELNDCFVQVSPKADMERWRKAVETLVITGLAARKTPKPLEQAAMIIESANEILKKEPNAGDEGLLSSVINEIDRLVLSLRSLDSNTAAGKLLPLLIVIENLFLCLRNKSYIILLLDRQSQESSSSLCTSSSILSISSYELSSSSSSSTCSPSISSSSSSSSSL
jgi:hypothetical protein